MGQRMARDLHPGAWWLWALGLAAAASATTNPWLLLITAADAGFVVVARRSDHPWSRSFGLYVGLAIAIVVIRVLFRIVRGAVDGGHVLFTLPEIPLPDWVAGVRLLGPVSRESLLAGLYDGMRLATIVLCVGSANALANPKRLLKSMPPALYEIGSAVVVAVSILPQLGDSVQRVRAARRLRGVPGGRVARLRGVVVPVLEDALERSMSLAAGMDARGYGRTGELGTRQRNTTGALMMAGLAGVCAGTYGLLDQTTPGWLGVPMLVLGVVVAAAGFVSAGARVARTRYRPDRWRVAEVVVALSGVLVAAGTYLLTVPEMAVAHPPVSAVPVVTMTALVVVLVGLLPALASPPPAVAPARRTEVAR